MWTEEEGSDEEGEFLQVLFINQWLIFMTKQCMMKSIISYLPLLRQIKHRLLIMFFTPIYKLLLPKQEFHL